MAGYYWIKLFLEILDDSKMAILPDRLWRRVIELFLFAGEYQKSGALPDTAQIAWRFRMPMEDLDLDLRQLEPTGIIKRTETGWLIPKFEERQRKLTAAERMQLFRDKQKRDQYYGKDEESSYEDVTLSNARVTQITDNRLTDNRLTDTETDAESVSFTSNILSLYSQYFKREPEQAIIATLHRADKEYKQEWLSKAFEIAAGNGRNNWAYVEGILKNWKANPERSNNNGRRTPARRDTEEARKKYGEWER